MFGQWSEKHNFFFLTPLRNVFVVKHCPHLCIMQDNRCVIDLIKNNFSPIYLLMAKMALMFIGKCLMGVFSWVKYSMESFMLCAFQSFCVCLYCERLECYMVKRQCVCTMQTAKPTMQTLMVMKWMPISLKVSCAGQRLMG